MDLLATNEGQQTVASSDVGVLNAIYPAADIPVATEVEITSEQNRAARQKRVKVVPITAYVRMHGRREEAVEHFLWIVVTDEETGRCTERLYHRQEGNEPDAWEDEPDAIVNRRSVGSAVVRRLRRYTPPTRSRIYLRTHTSNRSSIARRLRRLRLRKELVRGFLKQYYDF